MKLPIRIAQIFLLAASLSALAGCHKDAVSVCKNSCDKSIACVGGSSGMIVDCKNKCQSDANVAAMNNCKNANDVQDCIDNCNNGSCNGYLACLLGCPKCVN